MAGVVPYHVDGCSFGVTHNPVRESFLASTPNWIVGSGLVLRLKASRASVAVTLAPCDDG
jgi:hypothetical protein